MQVRVFESNDMASGLKMIKQELGPDALILSTRTVRSGKLGMIGKPMLEITAAIDQDAVADQPVNHGTKLTQNAVKRKKLGLKKNNYTRGHKNSFNAVVDDTLDMTAPKSTESHSIADIPPQKPQPQPGPNQGPRPDLNSGPSIEHEEIRSEVKELKKLVAGLTSQLQSFSENSEKNTQSTPQLQINSLEHANNLSAPSLKSDPILTMLISRGVEVETARTITGFLRESLTDIQLGDTDNLVQMILETLENLIDVNPPQFDDDDSQKRIALVGPTGVGKTTTIAKICASFLSNQSKSVALITIDTYRIAAVEQLRVYGEIMNIPIEVIITPDQLAEALERHGDKDLILIDTAGRSPLDSCSIDELATFLTPELNIDIHLVLSATNRECELVDTLKNFNKLDLCNTIFTKVDECSTLGVLLNIQLQNPTPLSYIANGQRVPEDLIEVTPQKVAELIMNKDQGAVHG